VLTRSASFTENHPKLIIPEAINLNIMDGTNEKTLL
jgi:hypothetical protein